MSEEAKMTNELARIIDAGGLESNTGEEIKGKFLVFFQQADEWKKKAEALVVTSADQKEEIKQAREARLEVAKIRINADKIRKVLKQDSLRYGKAVQDVYNKIESVLKPIEKHLENQEKFVWLQEQESKAKLGAERELEIEPLKSVVPYNINLGDLSEEDYQNLLAGAKLQLKAKQDAEQKEKANKAEVRRKADLERERRFKTSRLVEYIDGYDDIVFADMSEKKYAVLVEKAVSARMKKEKERERIRKENLKLKAQLAVKLKEEQDKIGQPPKGGKDVSVPNLAINIIFDGPPSPGAARFVEIETDDGKSINIGDWIDRKDGYWALRITELPKNYKK